MPRHSRDRLAARRAKRRYRDRTSQRRATIATLSLAALLGVVALVVGLVSSGSSSASEGGPVAEPVPAASLAGGDRPPDLTLANAEQLELRLPVDPELITAVAFHAVSNPELVALEPADDVDHETAPRGDRSGPSTAAVDVGAPAGTVVYAPIDGTVSAVADYRVAGEVEGYELVIDPSDAAGELIVKVTHLDPMDSGPPTVGSALKVGESVIGRIRDFSGVAEQELSQFTSDAGNHVGIEVARTGSQFAP
jgi:murein DD-endopeptidase MepM/ murein hydrolase activator NlpD